MSLNGLRNYPRFNRVIQFTLFGGGGALVLSGFLIHSIVPNAWDPLWVRIGLAATMVGLAFLPSDKRADKAQFYQLTSVVYAILGSWLLTLAYFNTEEILFWFQIWLYIGLASVLMRPVMRYWWFAGILSLGLLLISSLARQEIVHAHSHVPWMLVLLLANGILLDFRNRSGKRIRAMAELAENGPIPIFEVDKEGTILYVNQQFSRLLGYDLQSMVDKSLFSLIHSDSLPDYTWLTDSQKPHELIFMKRNGEELPALVNLSPVKEWEDDQIIIVGSITEISALKAVEHQLKERNEQMDLFLYKATHDLKGPLASVKGILDIAIQDCQQPEINQYIRMALTSTDKLDQALIDLLHVTRLNKADLIIEEVNCKELLEEILFSLKHMPESREVRFGVKVDDQARIFTDKNTLTTILQNLVVNAIKYKKEGNPDHQVEIDIKPISGGIYLKVSDNGEGIKPEIQEKVFNMFYRGNKKSKGTGLGLYIVKQGTEKLGGTLSLMSVFDRGTTFELEIPSWNPVNDGEPHLYAG